MERRSWPWKKKSCDKTGTTDTKRASLPNSGDSPAELYTDDSKIVKYVQLPMESYAQLTELEGQVKDLNAKISDLNDKLSSTQLELSSTQLELSSTQLELSSAQSELSTAQSDLSSAQSELSSAQSEISTKDNLVKQHAKVALEAVSGWENAEAEAVALKHQLESVMLLKLTAEHRVSQLDDALKECMKRVQNVKEESEQELHDVVFAKTKKWENAKSQLEARIVEFEQELLRASAENAALSRSLQERSHLLMKISDEKSRANAEIEVMKSDIETCEEEINSLKYELHVVSKELEIRNEEKNMSVRSAEVANKQHLEDVKKISKLEAECQRLRGLVRKRLPGPAALAQMKLEVENLGRDYGESRQRRSPAKSSSPHQISSSSDFGLENMQQCRKENEFLTERLLTMEEEMKMLKEALSERNSELQASRDMCAKTASKLHRVEAHALIVNQQTIPTKSITEININEEGSCSKSGATALMPKHSQIQNEKNLDEDKQADNSNQLELMDDFLEMEKLAFLSCEVPESTAISEGAVNNMITGNADSILPLAIQNNVGGDEQVQVLLLPPTSDSSSVNHPSDDLVSDKNDSLASNIQLKIARLFESRAHGSDIHKLLEDVRQIVQDAQHELPQHSVDCVVHETDSLSDTCMEKECHEDMVNITVNSSRPNADRVMDQELREAIARILHFVLSIGKGAAISRGGTFSNDSGLTEKLEGFSASVNKVLCNEENLDDFIMALSCILSETTYLKSDILIDNWNEGESYCSDCIDKVALLENKVSQHENANEAKERFSYSPSSSNPEIDGPLAVGFHLKETSQECLLENFERLKMEKEDLEIELARCHETLELTKLQLLELKSRLATSENSNDLAETRLKCMAESYKSLESRKEELENEVSVLHTKAELLVNELQEEKHSHQDDLAKYKELQDQIERNNNCSTCSIPSDADDDTKTIQEREIAAAAEKLAECQETIFLLSKHLSALRFPENQRPKDERASASELVNSQPMLSPHQLDQNTNNVSDHL